MGSSASGASAAESSKEKSQTFAKQSVASSGNTFTTSSGAKVSAPPPRPDLNYQGKSILGKIGQDIAMGVDDLMGQRSDKYSPAEWQAYDIRTAQTQARAAADQGGDRDEPQAMTQTAAQTGGGGQTAPATVGSETPGEARLGIRKDPSGQVIGRSMQPDTGKSATQEFVSGEAPGWFRSDIYDATVNALEAGKPLENYRIEGRGTQGTLTIVFDDGTRVATGFRDSKDVRAHADQMVALGKKYQEAGIGQQAEPEKTQIEQTQETMTQAVDELTMPSEDRAAREREAGTTTAEERVTGSLQMDVGTAAGAAAERAAAEKTATSEAEREAADALLKGRRSTILTTPGGLLAPSEEQVTRTRSLIGGRRRA
jgi:hypothetical protein